MPQAVSELDQIERLITMPRTSRPSAYGPEYEQLLRRAHSTGSITIPCADATKVKSLRSKLYAYFAALRKQCSDPALLDMADALNLIPSEDGLSLEIKLKSQCWDTQAILAALGTPTQPISPAQVTAPESPDDMVARLHRLRNPSTEDQRS